ncbi:YrhB domain-containing protein [Kitasatospora sp. NPDC053057]|uniref:YrhB domain-containing protein n=1 Tax=Kitasatospora sp. NPDC053057 TaxID=3364062 RepID=UPI0037C96619
MTRQEVIEAARARLSVLYPMAPPTIVLRDEWIKEYRWAWKVAFDTQEYLDTGDTSTRPMSRHLYVRKDNGAVEFISSALSVKQSNYFLETGIFPPPPDSEL